MRLNRATDGGTRGRSPAAIAGVNAGAKNGGRGLGSAARFLRRAVTHPAPSIRISPLLAELALVEPAIALERLGSSAGGLPEDEVARRLERHGPNVVAGDQRHGRLRLFAHACLNPLVLLLAVLALVSAATGDMRAAVVMV